MAEGGSKVRKCQYDKEKLLDYSLELLSEQEIKQISHHINSCKECQWKLQEFDLLQQTWNNPDEHTFTSDFVDNIIEKLPAKVHTTINKPKTSKPNNKFTSVIHYVMATAATFLLLYTGVFDQMPSYINQYSNQMMEASLQLNQVSEHSFEAINEMDNTFTNLFNFNIHQ